MRLNADALRLTLLCCVVNLPGCGAWEPTFPDYRPQDYPPVKTTILQDGFRLEPGEAVAIDFEAPREGHLIATVDWTHPSNNVLAALARQECDDVNLALAERCAGSLAPSEASTCVAKPRILTAGISAAMPVRLYVANSGASAESGRVQVQLCHDAPGCAAGAACAQCILEALDASSCH